MPDYRQLTSTTLNTVATCAACAVTGLSWVLTVSNACNAMPWTITNNNLDIRYDIEDSSNCSGTCGTVQAGTATATITVGANNVEMGLDFSGMGEAQASQFEKITFDLDGTQLARANAPGGGLGCVMGAVVKTYVTPSPYLLQANSVHTLLIDFSTVDALYHVNAFYNVQLTFTEV